ncbi:cytochrome P450 2D15-like isoform X2 [Dendrobates tinctorius]|uniref:cytochrome P450 2D15-like isoform X2 n=1 Tax=Dendrobates tinctorius TaxID=92724 RepID=UPI003CC96338
MAEFISLLFSNVFLLGITIIICLLVLDFVKSRNPGSHFPPGPRGLPFLGNILQVDFRNPTITLNQLGKEFGTVYSLQYFWKKIVVLNGFEVHKEALINRSEDISDRPRFPMFEKIGYAGDTKDQFDPILLINNAVSNVICSIVFGDRFEYNDEKFKHLLRLLNATLKTESGLLAQILNEIPILNHIPWLADYVVAPEYELIAFLKEMIVEHQKTWDPSYTRDFIDAYLVEMKKVKEDGSTSFHEGNLLMTTYDLFSVGTETTSSTMRWAVLFMLLYPDVQSKVQEEIDRVIGRERKPTMGDVLQMPYTNAVIHEVQRYGDISPLALPHLTYRDTEIKGYLIPKGTTIIINLSSVLKDHKFWEKPLQFYPKHFLDENGKFVKREAFIPFSAGRRVCLAEQLARMELFLLFTTLLQQLTFEIPSDQPRPREDPFYAFTQKPNPYSIRVVARV